MPPNGVPAAGQPLDLLAILPGHAYPRHAVFSSSSRRGSTRLPVRQLVQMVGALHGLGFEPVKRPPWTSLQYFRARDRLRASG